MSDMKAAIRPGLNRRRQFAYHCNRKGAGWSGPCNPGGVSPSLHHDYACVTGPIFTGPGQSTHTQSQNGFLEPHCAWVDAPASSGSIQFLDETKAIQPAPFPISLRVAAATFLTGGLTA
jgi:hypothetical protein